MQRFRGGLVFKAHRLLYSTLASRMIQKKRVGYHLNAALVARVPPHRCQRHTVLISRPRRHPRDNIKANDVSQKSTRPGMPPDPGGILRSVHFWQVPFALTLSPGRCGGWRWWGTISTPLWSPECRPIAISATHSILLYHLPVLQVRYPCSGGRSYVFDRPVTRTPKPDGRC